MDAPKTQSSPPSLFVYLLALVLMGLILGFVLSRQNAKRFESLDAERLTWMVGFLSEQSEALKAQPEAFKRLRRAPIGVDSLALIEGDRFLLHSDAAAIGQRAPEALEKPVVSPGQLALRRGAVSLQLAASDWPKGVSSLLWILAGMSALLYFVVTRGMPSFWALVFGLFLLFSTGFLFQLSLGQARSLARELHLAQIAETVGAFETAGLIDSDAAWSKLQQGELGAMILGFSHGARRLGSQDASTQPIELPSGGGSLYVSARAQSEAQARDQDGLFLPFLLSWILAALVFAGLSYGSAIPELIRSRNQH